MCPMNTRIDNFMQAKGLQTCCYVDGDNVLAYFLDVLTNVVLLSGDVSTNVLALFKYFVWTNIFFQELFFSNIEILKQKI